MINGNKGDHYPSDKDMEKRILPVGIEGEMKKSYLDYAMSVIVGRALPSVNDGLKPVHRRILYAMYEMGLMSNKPYKKSARVVGDVLGKYHPHGDSAVYDALVRMAQPFSMNIPLIDGHGNFGSVDGDAPAAMRYTEVRLSKAAEMMLEDIDKDTVDFIPNFDDSLKEPVVLPSKLPNLLVNGSSGIAVGLATNIPPHNLNEIADAICYMIDNIHRYDEITTQEIMRFVKGPDFPTGGIIKGKKAILEAYEKGRGIIEIWAKAEIEENGKEKRIVITEIPYQVNKSKMIEEIANLVKEGRIDTIKDIRDESDREGIRVIIELKKDANAEVTLNYLYKHTSMRVGYGILNIALVGIEPRVLSLKEMIKLFINHRMNVIIRKAKYELSKAREREHIVDGLIIALKNIDEVIRLIKSSRNKEEGRQKLMERFGLSEVQSEAILNMQLHRLTSLEREKLYEEKEELKRRIEDLEDILAREERRYNIIKEETLELKKMMGWERRTRIEEGGIIETEELIDNVPYVILVSNENYIKRVPLSEYRIQRRGGKGIVATSLKDDDYVKISLISNALDILLLFTSRGRVYAVKTYNIPEVSRYSKGKSIYNLLESLEEGEKINAILSIPQKEMEGEGKSVVLITKRGIIKRTPLTHFSNIRRTGIKAIILREGDELIDAKICEGNEKIMLFSRKGLSVKFDSSQLRDMGRVASGVIGMKLEGEEDEVVGMEIVNENDVVATITSRGYGKRSFVKEYRETNRGTKGIKNIKLTSKNGEVRKVIKVKEEDELIITTQYGKTIRIRVKDLPLLGRNTQGVRIIRLEDNDEVASVAKVVKSGGED